MKTDGLLIVLSGFSGTGKGTIVKEVMKRFPERYALSVSATTRSPRPGEVHGREYFFCTDAEFEEMVRGGALLEHAGYVGHYYGTPRSYVERMLTAGYHVILEIERQGAMQIREAMPQAVLIFVLPPSAQELERRLIRRGSESPQVISQRLRKACEEVSYVRDFDYVIINDDLDEAVKDFDRIVCAQAHRTDRCGEQIAAVAAGLRRYG